MILITLVLTFGAIIPMTKTPAKGLPVMPTTLDVSANMEDPNPRMTKDRANMITPYNITERK